MIQELNILATAHTPHIKFDLTDFTFEIIGESRPENVNAFYSPVRVWLSNFKSEIATHADQYSKKNLTINFQLDYFNSSSIKFIYDCLKDFEFSKSYLNSTKVIWIYNLQDDTMCENGLELSKIIDIPFELVSK